MRASADGCENSGRHSNDDRGGLAGSGNTTYLLNANTPSSVVSRSVGGWVGCSHNPLTTRFRAAFAECPQVKKGNAHSTSETVSAVGAHLEWLTTRAEGPVGSGTVGPWRGGEVTTSLG